MLASGALPPSFPSYRPATAQLPQLPPRYRPATPATAQLPPRYRPATPATAQLPPSYPQLPRLADKGHPRSVCRCHGLLELGETPARGGTRAKVVTWCGVYAPATPHEAYLFTCWRRSASVSILSRSRRSSIDTGSVSMHSESKTILRASRTLDPSKPPLAVLCFPPFLCAKSTNPRGNLKTQWLRLAPLRRRNCWGRGLRPKCGSRPSAEGPA